MFVNAGILSTLCSVLYHNDSNNVTKCENGQVEK